MSMESLSLNEDLSIAYPWNKKLAEMGNQDAMHRLAEIHLHTKEYNDLEQAYYWLKKAAEQGNTSAALELAALYSNGVDAAIYTEVGCNPKTCIQKDLEQAIFWTDKAREALANPNRQ